MYKPQDSSYPNQRFHCPDELVKTIINTLSKLDEIENEDEQIRDSQHKDLSQTFNYDFVFSQMSQAEKNEAMREEEKEKSIDFDDAEEKL